VRRGDTPGWWKAQELSQEQRERPGPFIWIDDDAIRLHVWRVLQVIGSMPNLMISPESTVGITRDSVRDIETWLAKLNRPGFNLDPPNCSGAGLISI
jgi:hypothetical protein